MSSGQEKGPVPVISAKRVRKFERRVVEEIEIPDTPAARAAARREWRTELKFVLSWIGLWGLLSAATLFVRGPWLPDEARMLAIAWDMWAHGRLALPSLNGEPELTPPLWFWLVHAGWFGFGVSDWWPRLLTPLGALFNLVIVQRLAWLLWPQQPDVARYAPLMLLGTFAFAFMTTATLPDMWTLGFVLLGYWALLIHWRRRDMRAWILLGAALGFGALTAGFIFFIYVVPVAIVAPLWARAPRPRWSYWYADLAKALVLAILVLASWLIAAARADGAPYVARFLAHAWSGIPVEMFALRPPWWWYALLAPAVFLPWSVLPLAWMRLWHIRREPLEDGFVFCLAWGVLPLLLLSLLPVKQAQFLLPLLPAGTLLAARLLLGRELREVYGDNALAGMAAPLLVLGGAFMALPKLPRVEFLPGLLWEQSPLLGLAIMAVGIASAWLPFSEVRRRAFDVAAASVVLVIFVLLGFAAQFNARYPMAEVGRLLHEAQARGQPVAHIGEYRGEFDFAGRLPQTLAVIAPERAENWAAVHPDGVLVTYVEGWQPRGVGRTAPLFETVFRGGRLRLFSSWQVLSAAGASGS